MIDITTWMDGFLKKTHDGKMIVGYGGIDKYYK